MEPNQASVKTSNNEFSKSKKQCPLQDTPTHAQVGYTKPNWKNTPKEHKIRQSQFQHRGLGYGRLYCHWPTIL
jgi:hypothetical protein